MQERTEAERYLLEEIRRGRVDGSDAANQAWSQLVERYEGRLTAFARRMSPKGADAEDLVQDTFLHFLRGLANFREEASIESYLFLILRRRIAETHRGRAAKVVGFGKSQEEGDAEESLPAQDQTASWYARRDEQRDAAKSALTGALRLLIRKMHEEVDLRDLQIVELVFYAQWPNQKIESELGVPAEQVALLKHRWLKQLRERVAPMMQHKTGGAGIEWESAGGLDSLLTEIWEDERPSCLKRSTVGGYVLQTLDEPWQKYVDFHVHRLGCAFCRANWEDLQEQSRQDAAPLRNRIMQSTVGFFRKG